MKRNADRLSSTWKITHNHDRRSIQDNIALWVCLLGVVFSPVFGLIALRNLNSTLALIDLTAGIICLINGLLLRKKPGVIAYRYTIVVIFFLFFFYLFFSGGEDNSGFIWGILISIAPVFFLGLRAGTFISLLYLLIILVSHALLNFFDPDPKVITGTALARFAGAYIICCLLAIVYEKSRVDSEHAIALEMHNRDEAEKKFNLSQEQQRLLTEHAVSAVAVHELVTDSAGTPIDYIFISANPAFEEHTGLKGADVIGRRVTEVLPGIEQTPLIGLYGNVVLTGEPISLEHFSEQMNRHFLIHAYKLDKSSFATVFTDITEHKRAEVMIHESELRLRGITDSTQDAIIMMNSLGLITFWNPAASVILGYQSEEAMGQNLHKMLAPERFLEAHNAAFPKFVEHGQGNAVGQTIELAARRKDGREITISLSLSAVSLDNEWHAVGILRDVTEQKRAEEALLEANRQLVIASVRANELAERAEMANIAKSEFLANMSHEIRTPMNGVIGMTGLLLDTEMNEEQRKFAEIIQGSAESLLGLINDILDFSKIEAGKLDLEILDFDLQNLLDDLSTTMALKAHAKGLELTVDTDTDVPTILRGDPGRLRQILDNLAGNAIKFTPKGEVNVKVSMIEDRTSPSDSVLLRFSIKDTGIGIPEEKFALLFEKFTQADSSTTRQYGGTGLGLSISKQLAELMGGEIGLFSKPGEGSEFWFSARLERQPDAVTGMSQILPVLQGVRVLIVDDNATCREILATRLNSWGMRPSEAPGGQAALAALKHAQQNGDPFQIAIIDKQMPEMDGDTLIHVIRADRMFSRLSIVLLSSMSKRAEFHRDQKIRLDGCIAKPVRKEELRELLIQVMARRNEPDIEHLPIATHHSARESTGPFSGRKLRVLLAEDNVTNQQVALGILKKFGLSADAVANGFEVISAIESIPYNLILMDVQMPDMDGLEATKKIREREAHRSDGIGSKRSHIPIIAMTAHAMQGDREKCIAAGMDDYIPKPIIHQTLLEILKKWLPASIDRNIGTESKFGDGFH